MRRILSSIQDIEITRYLLSAIIPGISGGIFLHGYWLIDIFPVDSRWLLFSTLLACLLGTAGYILLFRWMRNGLLGLSKSQLAGLIGSGIVVGAFLFFTVTDRWQLPARYVSFFLPSQTLQVSIPPAQSSGRVSILWINTSLKDVSYDAIDYRGWKRENDRLVLTDFSDNSLRWSGKTGEKVQIIFEVPAQSGEAVISWNGQEEVLRFSAKKNPYARSFDIPYFASREWILLLGVFNFVLLSFSLCLSVWGKRLEMLQVINHAMVGTSRRLDTYDVAILLGVIALALLLRVPNLENLFPGVDEYYQLNAAKQITQGVPMAEVYQRSLWLVTVPVSLMFRVFGYKVWVARLLAAIFNVLAILPLYLIARKINRPIAVLSILLYATSPWIITFGRLVREYAYYPFLYYWIIHAMILFWERFPARFRIDRDLKSLLTPSLIWLGLGLVLPPLYALFVDITSTFKLILIAYVVLGIFIFLKMDLTDKRNLFVILFMVSIILVSAYFWLVRFSVSLGFNLAPVNYFFLNPPQQWYFDRLAIIPVAGLLGVIVASFLIRRVNIIPLFLLALYVSFLSFFLFSSNEFFGTRHLSTTQLWYVILMAIGLYMIWVFMQTFSFMKDNRIKFLAAVVMGLSIINAQQSLLPITNSDPDMPISEDYHYDIRPVHEYLLANVQDGDVLIDTVYDLYATWQGEPEFQAVYRFYTASEKEDILSLVDQYDSGWIVIDKIRLEMSAFSPLGTFSRADGIEYVGLFGDEYVWHWRKQP